MDASSSASESTNASIAPVVITKRAAPKEESYVSYGHDGKKIDFASRDYWENRFVEEEEFEWLGDFPSISSSLYRHLVLSPSAELSLPFDAKIAIIGCGNSNFSYQMYKAGFRDITNTDFSENVIDKMRMKQPMMKWVVDDMTNSKLPEDYFDFIIEKGAMDCLTQDEGDPWNPNDKTWKQTKDMMESVMKSLKSSTGKFLQISFQQPHFRKKYLTQVPLKSAVIVDTIDFGLGYFLYVCLKP